MSDQDPNESPLLADPVDPVEPPVQEQQIEQKPAPAAPAPQPDSAANPRFKFYVLRVASNKEDRVKTAIDRKVKIEGVEEKVGRVLVPTERVRSMKGGVRKEADRKLYPGYVFIELEPDENGMIPQDVWFMVKETEGVGDFIQASGKPQPMSRSDRDKMLEVAEKKPEEQANLKTEYKKGDKIKVTDGAFENFEGEVDEIVPDKGVVRIITTIFGRPTPLELEYWQIERV